MAFFRNCHYLIILFSAFFKTTSASNTVGTACVTNATCTGVNEYCQQVTWLQPSCLTGICQCLPCYTTGDFTGYSWATYPCAPIVKLNVGDSCKGSYNEYYLVKGSRCQSDGLVDCEGAGHVVKDGRCVRNGPSMLGEGEPCDFSDECAGDLWCGLNFTCECFYSYQHFDSNLNQCVKKELGDPCSADEDCKVSGRNWDGFTWSSGACVDGVCDCEPGSIKTPVSYIDGITGLLKSRTICVAGSGTVNVSDSGYSICSVDPVYYGDSDLVRVCSQDFVCESCPEEHDWSTGRCRRVIGNKPEPLACPTYSDNNFKPEVTTVPPIPTISTVGKPCFSNETCSGMNEFCQEITWLSPSCLTGVCQCLPNFSNGLFIPGVVSPITEKPCLPVVFLNLGDTCSEDGGSSLTTREFFADPFSECAGGKVECKSGFLTDWTNRCVAFVGSGEGASCEYSFQCAGEMRCVVGNVCGCLSGARKFNPLTGECVVKSYGDVCNNHEDCSHIDQAASCIHGTCNCIFNHEMIVTNYVDPLTGTLSNKTHCIPAGAGKLTLVAGAECSPTNPVFISSIESSGVQVCETDHACLSCPEDSGLDFGKCRMIIGSIPEPPWKSPLPFLPAVEAATSTTPELPTTEPPTTTTERSTATTTTTTATESSSNDNDNEMNECIDDESCNRADMECVRTYCHRKCQCKDGYVLDEENLTCKPIRHLELDDKCNDLAIDEQLPPHTVCKDSKVTCNSYHYRVGSNRQCVALTTGTFGSKCSGASTSCLSSDSSDGNNNELWCDSSSHTCRCYESLALKWNDQLDKCEKREYGDSCSNDTDCTVYGDVTNGGFTYGGGSCSRTTGQCVCSPNFIAVNFSYLASKTPSELRSKLICVHKSAKTGLKPGEMCLLDPIYYGDNPLGFVRICRAGDVCVRCENDPTVKKLSMRHGYCMSGRL